MPEPITDPLADLLAAVQLRAGNVRECPPDAPDALWRSIHGRSAQDVPRLLAAVEAVLAQHQPGRVVIVGALCPRHEAHRHFSITSTEAASVVACPDCPASVWNSCTGCGPQMPVDSCPVRTAISAALLGEVPGA